MWWCNIVKCSCKTFEHKLVAKKVTFVWNFCSWLSFYRLTGIAGFAWRLNMIGSVDFRPFFSFLHWPMKAVVGTIEKEHTNVSSFTPVKRNLYIVSIHCILHQLPHYRCSPAFPVRYYCYIHLPVMVTIQNTLIRYFFYIFMSAH